MSRYVLGISAFYHDSSAVLVKNDIVLYGAHEERFTRKKHDSEFPKNAISFCLKEAGISAQDLEAVVFYDKPLLKFERIIKTALLSFPFGFSQFLQSIPVWLSQKLHIRSFIAKELDISPQKIFFTTHHLSHAGSAAYTSPFNSCAVLTLDGVGEFATTSISHMKNGILQEKQEIHFPHSLGLLYSTLTAFLGFKVNSAEYKVMGLAPYGKNIFEKEMNELISFHDDGSFSLNMKYFSFERNLSMYSKKLATLFKISPREPESKLLQVHFDIAHSLQKITEKAVLRLVKKAQEITGEESLALAGGVALNCVANEQIVKSGLFKNVYIQPASGDAGGALGAALYYIHTHLKVPYTPKEYFSPYLGPKYSQEEILSFLDEIGASYEVLSSDEECIKKASECISGDTVIGWFQGREEFGPRALGNRSIIADARNFSNWKKVNLKIKFREDFRPFAPTCLEEDMEEFFDLSCSSPYMLLTAPVKKTTIPAVTHKDNSARIQSVSLSQNPKYYALIQAFKEKTGVGVIINTSFNVRSEPIVLTPQDAWNTFINTAIDYLFLENVYIKKSDNLRFVDIEAQKKHLSQFELD
jgi:carbamoyltransferase